MTKTLFAVALVILGACGQLRSQQVEAQTVLVHLKADSPVAQQWIAAGRTGEIPILSKVLGAHETQGYVSAATLKAIERARASRYASMVVMQPLALIAEVRYSTLIDPRLASMKLSQLTGVELCEPLPKMHVVGQTNDPLLQQQYYIRRINADNAWDSLPDTDTIIVGIADTGIDTAHVDLQGNIWNNPGEVGQDDLGRDKRSNMRDDDGNGFIDDWYGWDFVGSNGRNPDNSPLPGNPHGTHVGGTVAGIHNNALGIAGVARNVQLMPLKIGSDDQFSTSIARSADAILYAASMGARVINCSFGSPSSSFADVKVIAEATRLGALVIGAAGNDGEELAYYPAAYDEAVSVAATDNSDIIAVFSNVHQTVDVCAPGVGIISTVPTDRYELYDGTSMASPVVTAVAAMVLQVHPEYTPAELRATLKASCENINANNPMLLGLIGNGRIDAARSVASKPLVWASISSFDFNDTDADSLFEATDTLRLSVTINNVLTDIDSCSIVLTNGSSNIDATIIDTVISVGSMRKGEFRTIHNAARFVLPRSLPENAVLRILGSIREGKREITVTSMQTIVNPTYRTMSANDITVTVNSSGNIGFNDYSANTQGVGFRYKTFPNILFEGALLIGTGPEKLPNAARGFESSMKDMSFRVIENTSLRTDSIPSGQRITCAFSDANDLEPVGISVSSNVIALTADSLSNTLLIVLRLRNTTDTAFTNLHVSEFFDFDIGDAGANDFCSWNEKFQLLHIVNAADRTLPHVAVAMISPFAANAFALDNEGATDCPSIYDDFLRSEKWFVMNGGVRRPRSSITDVSAAIGAGPIALQPDSTVEVCFALAAGLSESSVHQGIEAIRHEASRLGYNAGRSIIQSNVDEIVSLVGGTLQYPGTTELEFRLYAPTSVAIDIVDIQGRVIETTYNDPYIDAGTFRVAIGIPETSAGLYFIRLTTVRGMDAYPIFISAR